MSLILDCIYLLAGALLLPYWLWKLPQAPRYRAGIWQRLGFGPVLPPGRRLWIHCASVGEASIPRALVAEFRRRHANWDVVFSTNTDTGAARLRGLYPRAAVFYMPLDFSPCVRLALGRVRPSVILLVELEIWPNFMRACDRRGIPVAIVSGRIGERSRRGLRRLHLLCRWLWRPVRVCCARSADDARGFVEAGLPAERVFDCGSLKYGALATPPAPARVERLRALFAIGPNDTVLVAGSTHEGEEAILAGIYRRLKPRHARLRMVVAPRHVERARAAASAVSAAGLPVARMTALQGGDAAGPDDVIVVDTVGDLRACYALADCAFVGRSLAAPGGGQNMMEPAALGVPVLVGPHTGNFRPEMAVLQEVGAVLAVADGDELTARIDGLLSEPDFARQMGEAGRAVVEGSRGATLRTMDRLEALL